MLKDRVIKKEDTHVCSDSNYFEFDDSTNSLKKKRCWKDKTYKKFTELMIELSEQKEWSISIKLEIWVLYTLRTVHGFVVFRIFSVIDRITDIYQITWQQMHVFQVAFYVSGVYYALFIDRSALFPFFAVLAIYCGLSAWLPGGQTLSTRKKIMQATWTPPS